MLTPIWPINFLSKTATQGEHLPHAEGALLAVTALVDGPYGRELRDYIENKLKFHL